MRLPESSKNLMTLTGFIMNVTGSVVFWVMFILAQQNMLPNSTYIGLIIYLFLPAPPILGLLLIPLGMWRNRSAVREARKEDRMPVFDFNNPKHLNAAMIFGIGTIVMGTFITFVSYQGLHYTESVEFCGKLCHSVMEPEYTTYMNSPHARVACVECHVGKGADYYTKSKLSGLYQVYATARDIYPRPIETPVLNLRPARDTCEQCHWPGRLFPARERRFDHFLSEEDNAPWPITMLVEIGGQSADYEKHPGSHWHINEDVTVEYIATDRKRYEIPWVRLTYPSTGRQVVFESEDSPLEGNIADYQIRTMDCMDCHNRPSHAYINPTLAMNQFMGNGQVSTELPDIKPTVIEILAESYATREEAHAAIETGINDYYSENYPEIASEKKVELMSAIAAVTQYYSDNFFPDMNAQWDIYPLHMGHIDSPGCYRCHDGLHVTEEGASITDDCNSCHMITAQGEEHAVVHSGGLEFKHPIDIDEEWKEMACYECHSGE